MVGADHLEGFIELFILDVAKFPKLGVMSGLEILSCLFGRSLLNVVEKVGDEVRNRIL